MPEAFRQRLEQLHYDIVQQGHRVEALVERAFEAVFEGDRAKAAAVVREDDVIDHADIEIEKAAVELLTQGEQDPKRVRMILTIVKVNNELERIADLAADAAGQAVLVAGDGSRFPPTLRMTVNSVVGMVRDANRALRDMDVKLARIVLASDDLVDRFSETLLREVQQSLAAGKVSVDFAGAFWLIRNSLERIADHATNVAEQVIYVESGQIVRHLAGGWSEPRPPA